VGVAESVGEVERRPARLVDGVLVPAAAVLSQRRGRRDGGRVDDAPHRAGALAQPQDGAHRVHRRLSDVLVLRETLHRQAAVHYYYSVLPDKHRSLSIG
jgi:hypothetical protein